MTAAALGLWLLAVSAPAACAPTTVSRPASAPEAYPPAALVAATRKAAAEMAARLDRDFHSVLRPPFAVLGNLPPDDLAAYADQDVVTPAKVMWSCYFQKRPNEVITVLLFKDDASYRAWAKTLFGDTDVSHFGYYKPDRRTMVMNIGTGGGTLIHELTHALIVYDFPDVPTWFNEGLGSLHEGCRIERTRIVGVPNWRLVPFQKAIREKTVRPLKELVSAADFYSAQRANNYAQARYFVMYLQQKGVLEPFYAYYRGHAQGDDAAVKAIEHILGKPLADIEPAYLAWVLTLRE